MVLSLYGEVEGKVGDLFFLLFPFIWCAPKFESLGTAFSEVALTLSYSTSFHHMW